MREEEARLNQHSLFDEVWPVAENVAWLTCQAVKTAPSSRYAHCKTITKTVLILLDIRH